jgi:hypothetical protein
MQAPLEVDAISYCLLLSTPSVCPNLPTVNLQEKSIIYRRRFGQDRPFLLTPT